MNQYNVSAEKIIEINFKVYNILKNLELKNKKIFKIIEDKNYFTFLFELIMDDDFTINEFEYLLKVLKHKLLLENYKTSFIMLAKNRYTVILLKDRFIELSSKEKVRK